MSTSFVIETHELSKTYKNVQALKSLDLKVHQNSIFGFLGPNGAGKTTTLRTIAHSPAHLPDLVWLWRIPNKTNESGSMP